MKKIIITSLCTILTIGLFAQINEKAKIKEVIQTAYVEGLLNEGDFQKIDKGFHPNFEMLGVGKGNSMWKYPIVDWKNQVKKDKKDGKFPKKGKEKISIKFLNIDITGTVAVAKFEFYQGKKLAYIDYQSLYKFEDGWKIVSKVFHEK